MGASSWSYFVPFQDDVNEALQELRRNVFQNDEYYTEAKFLTSMLNEKGVRERLSPESIQRFQDRMMQLRDQPPPSTIQELMQINGDSGTHSIIDIQGVSERPEFRKISPLPSQILVKLFGTERPIREIVEQKISEIQVLCGTWQGVYVIVFQNDLPSEILFTGVSGD